MARANGCMRRTASWPALDRGSALGLARRAGRGPRPAAASAASGGRGTARARPCHPPSRAVSTETTSRHLARTPAGPADPGIGASSGCTPGVRRGTAMRMFHLRDHLALIRRLEQRRCPGSRPDAPCTVSSWPRPRSRSPWPGLAPAAARGGGDAPEHRRRPNILFVLADDLDLAEMRYLPRTCRRSSATARHDLRPVPREQLAVLPVAHHHPARAVRAQHRRVDQRRRQRRLRAGPRQRRRAGHRGHPAAPRRATRPRSSAST